MLLLLGQLLPERRHLPLLLLRTLLLVALGLLFLRIVFVFLLQSLHGLFLLLHAQL